MNRATLTVLFLILAPTARTVWCDLQDVDPAQYGDVARHMVASGHWLDLSDSKGPFTNKPPLLMWAQAVTMTLLRETAVAARLGATFFTLVLLAATFALGRALFSNAIARTATVLVAGSVALHMMLADPKTDVALAAMVTSALAAAVASRGRLWCVALAWAFAGLAVLAKGPTALVYLASALIPWWWSSSPLRWGRRLGAGVAASRWWLGVPLLLAICSPFYATVFRTRGEEGAVFLLWAQGFGRLLGQSGYHDSTTPLFFLHTALWALFPSLWVLGLAWFWARRSAPHGPVSGHGDPGVALCVGWFAVPFVAVSLADYKLPHYIFPLIVPLSLVAARWIERDLTPDAARARAFARTFFTGAVAFSAVFALPFAAWAVGPLAGLAALAWWALGPRPAGARAVNPPWGRVSLGASAVLFSTVFHLLFYPRLCEFQAWPALVREAARLDPTGRVTPVLDSPAPYSADFAATRPLPAVDAPGVAALVQRGQTGVVIAPSDSREALEAAGLLVTGAFEAVDFPTSRPTLAFLRPSTRASTLRRWSVFSVRPSPH